MRAPAPNFPNAAMEYNVQDENEFRRQIQQALIDSNQYRPEDFVTFSDRVPIDTDIPEAGEGAFWVSGMGADASFAMYRQGVWLPIGRGQINVAWDSVTIIAGLNLSRTVRVVGLVTPIASSTLVSRLIHVGTLDTAPWIEWEEATAGNSLDADDNRIMEIVFDRALDEQLQYVQFGMLLDDGSIVGKRSITIPTGIAPQEAVLLVSQRPNNSTAGVRGRLAVQIGSP